MNCYYLEKEFRDGILDCLFLIGCLSDMILCVLKIDLFCGFQLVL